MSGVDILGFNHENPGFARASQPLPNQHTTSVASSASSSVSSVFSLDSVSSVSSVGSTWESGASRESSCGFKPAGKPVAPELRQHPRRTQRTVSGGACPRPPPSLVSQNERKVSFVDRLVGEFYSYVSSIFLIYRSNYVRLCLFVCFV